MNGSSLIARIGPHKCSPPSLSPPRPSGKTPRGFTLIELLVVVSIIALLISILLPSLKNAREQARMVKCLAHMRGMGQAGMSFSLDYGNRFQLVADGSGIQRADPSHRKFAYDELTGEIYSWPVAMAMSAGITGYKHNWDWGVRADDWAQAESFQRDMATDFGLAICPSDKVKIATPYYPHGGSLAQVPPEFEIPNPNGTRYFGYLSYGINEDVVGADDAVGGYKPACWKDGKRGQIQDGAGPRLEGNLDKVFEPGTCMLLTDAGPTSKEDARNATYGDYTQDDYVNLIISAKANGPYLGDHRAKWNLRIPDNRHPKGALSVLFCDFHGERVRPVKYWQIYGVGKVPREYSPRVRVSPYPPYNPWE